MTPAGIEPATFRYVAQHHPQRWTDLIKMLCKLWFHLTDFLFCRCRVRVHSVVLEGTFGRVYRGTYAEEDGVEEEVLVKTVTGRWQFGFSYSSLCSVLRFQNRTFEWQILSSESGNICRYYLQWLFCLSPATQSQLSTHNINFSLYLPAGAYVWEEGRVERPSRTPRVEGAVKRAIVATVEYCK